MNGKKSKSAFFTISVLVALAIVFYIIAGFFVGQFFKAAPDIIVPMVNQHITWTGAGYNGIYGGNGR